jgi:hypothetical protein
MLDGRLGLTEDISQEETVNFKRNHVSFFVPSVIQIAVGSHPWWHTTRDIVVHR